jgi:hypothetical protein
MRLTSVPVHFLTSTPLCNGAVRCSQNIGKHREAIPDVVIVQSSLFDNYRRRVVIPLVRSSHLDNAAILAKEGDRITGAMDELFTRAWT